MSDVKETLEEKLEQKPQEPEAASAKEPELRSVKEPELASVKESELASVKEPELANVKETELDASRHLETPVAKDDDQSGGVERTASTELPKNDYTPIATSTEALQKATIIIPEKDISSEKLDELTSLEREIAEMHHIEPTAPVVAQRVNETVQMDDEDSDKVMLDMQPPSRNITPVVQHSTLQNNEAGNTVAVEIDSSTYTFGHEDLIAVLKGIDQSPKEGTKDQQIQKSGSRAENPSGVDTDLDEGVTIEGEGQFQIMEIIDDESEDVIIKKEENTEDTLPVVASHSNKSPVTKSFGNSVSRLTPDEQRAVAMEQIAGLKARVDRQRRRKQDIKAIHLENADLVTSLGADWSEDEATSDQTYSKPATTKTAVLTTETATTKSTTEPNKPKTVIQDDAIPEKKSQAVASKASPVAKKVVKVAESCNVADPTKESDKPVAAATLPQVTGFRRTRIIKRKIIWDPDAPETQFSYANLVRSTGKSQAERAPPKKAATVVQPASATPSFGGRETPTKKGRSQTPKEKKPAAATEKRPTTPAKTSPVKVANTNSTPTAEEGVRMSATNKRRSHTPVSNGAGGSGGKKKKISEIDRLMGDEGAVNMLNSLENERSKDENDDKPHKPLMRSRAATISLEKKRETTPTALKKDMPTTTGKTKRGPKQKASSSWDYVYKQQASDESMIIRRRSNSSYSSTASPRRLSLDGTVISKTKSASGSANAKPAPKMMWKGHSKSPNVAVSHDEGGDQHAGWKPKEAKITVTKMEATLHSGWKPRDRHLTDSPDDSEHYTGGQAKDEPNIRIISKPKAQKTIASPSIASMNATVSSTNSSTSTEESSGLLHAVHGLKARRIEEHKPTPSCKIFEFAKPESKLNQKINRQPKITDPLPSDIKKTSSPGTKRTSRSPVESKEKMYRLWTGSKEAREDCAVHGNSDVIIKKMGKVAQICFSTHKAKLEYTFTAKMMNKLVDILDSLSNDADCNAVVMTTTSPHFCQGIDFTDLTVGSIEKRKIAAVYLATAVKNYLKTLATFPKPLIVGVNGNNIGLGVTQLPLFDIVIAGEKSTFETPYAMFGQVPEGFCIWNNITKIRGVFKTKLFWLCEKLFATESALSGLVNKLFPSVKVNDEALTIAKKIASMSTESYRVMKKVVIQNHLDAIIIALDEEFDTIIEQWTSAECYDKFKKYLESRNF